MGDATLGGQNERGPDANSGTPIAPWNGAAAAARLSQPPQCILVGVGIQALSRAADRTAAQGEGERGPRMPIRTVVRLALVFAGGYFIGGRLVEALRAWRLWQRTAGDPAAAELYRTTVWLDLGSAALVAAIVGLLYPLLRPPSDVTGSRLGPR